MKKKWQILKSKAWFRRLSNRYVLASLFFAIWMSFFDLNSLLIHRELNREKEALQNSIEYYQRELERDRRQLQELTSDPEKLEKFAREQYYLVRPGEQIFLID